MDFWTTIVDLSITNKITLKMISQWDLYWDTMQSIFLQKEDNTMFV